MGVIRETAARRGTRPSAEGCTVLQGAYHCVIVNEVQDLGDLSPAPAIWLSSVIRASVPSYAAFR